MGQPWDVVVVGGGPGGGVCAATLARTGLRVLLAEAGAFDRPRPAEMWPPSTVRALRRIFPEISRTAVGQPCRGVRARWAGYEHFTDYELSQCGSGWIVQRPAVDREIFERAAALGVTSRVRWRGTRVIAGAGDGLVRVAFATPDGERVVDARYVVEATGRRPAPSATRRDYRDHQVAYAATVDETAGVDGLLWVESTRSGWWYLLDMPGSRTQIVFVTQARPPGRGATHREGFLREAFVRTRLVADALRLPAGRLNVSAFDARVSHGSASVPEGVRRIGDAHVAVDPLSGLGVMSAIRTGLDAAGEIATRFGRSIGAWQVPRAGAVGASWSGFDAHLAGGQALWSAAGIDQR